MKYALIAIAVLGPSALAWAAPAFAAPMNIDVVERADTDKVSLKAGTADDNLGDVQTFTNPIYNAANATRIGSDQGYCVRMVLGKSWECHWTTMLAKGQIMVDGPVSDTSDTELAITGGTGAYASAHGVLKLHPRDAKSTAYDFHFRLQ